MDALPAWLQAQDVPEHYRSCVAAAVQALLATHRELPRLSSHYPLFARRFDALLAATVTALQSVTVAPAAAPAAREFCRQLCITVRDALVA